MDCIEFQLPSLQNIGSCHSALRADSRSHGVWRYDGGRAMFTYSAMVYLFFQRELTPRIYRLSRICSEDKNR